MKISIAILSALFVTGSLMPSTHADTNYITITSAIRSNDTFILYITHPLYQPVTMDWSRDLITWSPLDLITNEIGEVTRTGFISPDGQAEITHTISPSEPNVFFRAIPWDLTEILSVK